MILEKVYIFLVNWNGWHDTIECLESVFRTNYGNYRVVVVDNGSRDDSLEQIKCWAAGELPVTVDNAAPLRFLTEPSVPKPVPYVEYSRSTAEGGGKPGMEPPLILIRSESNIGFAGGNNIALRYALARGDFKYAWLLNNDTVIGSDALSAMVRRIEDCPGAGMCGSLLPYYDRPDIIWTQGGGTFNHWLARSACIGNGLSLSEGLARNTVESLMKYVAGASLLVTRKFVEEVGLMSEDYFLYNEEPDWAFRGSQRYTLVYAPESIVYHKVGMSTKKGFDKNEDINFPEDYVFRSSLKFTLTFFPYALPVVFVRVAFNRLMAMTCHFFRKSGIGKVIGTGRTFYKWTI